MRPMRRPSRGCVASALALTFALAACGGGDDQATLVNPPASSAPTTTVAPTTTTLAPNSSQIAEATVPVVQIYAQPGDAAPIRTFDNPWHVNEDVRFPVPLVFLAESVRPDGWVQVLLPVRPNGSTGWIKSTDVRLRQNSFRVEVSVGAHHITVFQGAGVVYEGPVATGAPETPTPTGHYFIRVLIQAPDPNTVYGPFAYGLSSHSDVLNGRSTVVTARSASTATTTRRRWATA